MISYGMLFDVLSLVFVLGVLYYFRIKIKVLNDIVDVTNSNYKIVLNKQKDFEEKLNKKDPYEDYRNAKGLLSMRSVKEAKYGKSGM